MSEILKDHFPKVKISYEMMTLYSKKANFNINKAKNFFKL